MTWEIIAGLIVIVGCLVSLGTVLAKLVAVMTRLKQSIGEHHWKLLKAMLMKQF